MQDHSAKECLNNHDSTSCDQFVEEDCKYNGNTIINTQEGLVTNPTDCQELCLNNESGIPVGCEYWLYDRNTEICTLLDSDLKSCGGVGGHQTPKIEDCFNSF